MWSRIALLLLICACAHAQTTTTAAAPLPIDNDFLHQQFGNSCSLEPGWAPVTGDLNGDGVEDVVIVARCKNPLIDQGDKDFRVIDPLDAFYGYGNTKITMAFGQEDPRLRGLSLLVIHGTGPDAWRSANPQAKFVIVNLAVKTIAIKKMKVGKKRFRTAIYVEEATGDQMTSAIFWDGKKYRYEPMGSSME
jgi:hypothetical protein